MLEEKKEENWACVYEKYCGWDGMVALCILFLSFSQRYITNSRYPKGMSEHLNFSCFQEQMYLSCVASFYHGDLCFEKTEWKRAI